MKKYIASIIGLLSVFAVNAQSEAQEYDNSKDYEVEQFSAYGNGWIELSAGATIYNVDSAFGSTDQAGAIASIEDNYSVIDLSLIGLDLSWYFSYANVDFDRIGDIDSYTIGASIKPYVKLIDNNLFALRVFFNPFAAYTYTDFDTKFFRCSSDGSTYGVKTGIELSFLGNFYVAPAFIYTKVDSSGSVRNDFDMNTLALEFGCKLTSFISLHLNYNHNFEKEYYNTMKISSDTVSAGVRLSF